MRLFLAFSLLGLLAACSGDSSSVMSVWTDDDTGGSFGGGGQATTPTGTGGSVGSKGGSGGQATAPTGGSGGSVVSVRGGTRDVATAQCLTTGSGGGCPADGAYLQCLKDSCSSALAACYQGTGGPCADYAACMFACPCDSGRSDCESGCLVTKGYGNPQCQSRVVDLLGCGSSKGCATPICLLN